MDDKSATIHCGQNFGNIQEKNPKKWPHSIFENCDVTDVHSGHVEWVIAKRFGSQDFPSNIMVAPWAALCTAQFDNERFFK